MISTTTTTTTTAPIIPKTNHSPHRQLNDHHSNTQQNQMVQNQTTPATTTTQNQHHNHQNSQSQNSLNTTNFLSNSQSDLLSNRNYRMRIMRRFHPTNSSDPSNASFSSASVAGSIQDDNMSDQCSLTQAGLEEYNSRSYYDQPVFHHQKQSSYAQSEGYHSYVSSSDSTSATPFLDRLRQESELLSRQSHHWSQNDLSSSANSVSNVGNNGGENNSSESTSSTETLKWLGSMSDVSEASHATSFSAISGSASSSSQLIVHSSRVRTPKRQNSESVHYMNDDQGNPTVMVNNNNINNSNSLNNINNSNEMLSTGDGLSQTNGAVSHHHQNIIYSHHNQLQHHYHHANQTQNTTPSVTSMEPMSAPSSSSIYMSSTVNVGPTGLIKGSPTSSNSSPIYQSTTMPITTATSSSSSSSSSLSSGNDLYSHTTLTLVGPPTITTTTTNISGQQQQHSPSTPSSISLSHNILTSSSTSPTMSQSGGNNSSSYRNNHRLFPVSTYTEPVPVLSGDYNQTNQHYHHQYKQLQSNLPQQQQQSSQQQQQQQSQHLSGQQQQQQQQQQNLQHNTSTTGGLANGNGQMKVNSWHSVADRINDFERQQQHLHQHHQSPTFAQQLSSAAQKYSYIDPSKTHRVPNPALKAFQKNAVQSYFERQQQSSKENTKSYTEMANSNNKNNNGGNNSNTNGGVNGTNLLRPHSLQPNGSPKEVSSSHMLRNSLPNTFGSQHTNFQQQQHQHHQQQQQQHQQQSPLTSRNSSCGQQIRNSSPTIQINDDGSVKSFTDYNMPPPPPPRSRSLMPIRRSSSASEYADFRDQFIRASPEKLQSQSIQNVTNAEKSSFNDCGVPPPPPPPRGRASMPIRRTSSASEYAAIREKNIQARQNLGPMVVGPIISIDDWVPERPPKNPHLRIPSPDLPPPPSTHNQDDPHNQDPLPPPPPEIVNRQTRATNENRDQKTSSPSRRNSFAGSPSRKTFYRTSSTIDNLPPPPSIPKKPTTIEMMQSRPASSLAQSNKAHKVILNGTSLSAHSNGKDHPITNRKRPHNPNTISSISENQKSPSSKSNLGQNRSIKSPPPLKPRMPIVGAQEARVTSVAISSKLRCNSKASYLPRQTRDKLNTTDPDHGSYKLTLTSNEDCINQNHHNNGKSFHDDIMPIKCNNLPDVLPVGVKIQQSSPPSTISSPRYGSNNNLSPMTPPNPTTQHCYPSYPNMKLLISKPPVHTQTPITRQNSSPTSPISPSSYSISGSNRSSIYESSSPKFMSQSTIDLKKIHILETKEDLTSSLNENILSPAQSENNITTISNNNQNKKALSPFSAKKEFHRTDVARKLSLEERDPGEGRIVRAELVNTILSSSPITKSEEKITRKDSLRENIEKITQLQSKLMSAHLVDNGNERKLLGFTTKTINFQTLHASVDSGIDKYNESSALSKSPISVQIPKDIDITDLDAAIDNKNESPPPPTSSPPPLSPELPKASSGSDKISQMIPEFDGLKLMQRSELVLRVNPSTMEAASQTDEILDSDMCRLKLIEDSSSIRTTTLLPRAKHPAEIDCDNFSQDLVKHLPLNDKLSQLLVPSIIKTSADYICGLYNPNVTPRPAKRDVGTSTPVQFDELFDDGCEPLNCNAGIMESKMELQLTGIDVILVNGGSNSDSCDLTKKKEELVNRLKRKVKVLNHEQTTIGEETSINDELGCTLLTKVSTKLRSIDATKFRTYIDDVGHITSLLLSLSGRLAKMENLLHSITDNISEKKILETKRDRLLEQLDEAKRLKDDIDRRGSIVSKTLEQNLNAEEYADYDYFINMKAKLIVDSREIADKIKLSEEQLSALKDTLLQSDC